MSYIPLNQIIDALAELDHEQKQLLLNLLQESEILVEQTTSNKLTSIEAIREARFHEGLNCPHCAAQGLFKKNGTYRGRQRYVYKTCKRTFNDLTNTRSWDALS